MITLVMPYYDNEAMLQRHLREWVTYRDSDKMQLRVIIVDDASPNKPAVNVLMNSQHVGFPIELFRVLTNIPWNQDGARNLAMQQCRTDWALMTDMDHVLLRDQVRDLIEFAHVVAKPGSYYMLARRKADGQWHHPHPNTFLFKVSDFWSMGGYDEDFAGAYGSDGNFRRCARGAGLTERHLHSVNLTLFGTEDIEDANTKDWGRKDSGYHRSNFPALEAKRRSPPYRAKDPVRFKWEKIL